LGPNPAVGSAELATRTVARNERVTTRNRAHENPYWRGVAGSIPAGSTGELTFIGFKRGLNSVTNSVANAERTGVTSPGGENPVSSAAAGRRDG
jgi:hypothetical protein